MRKMASHHAIFVLLVLVLGNAAIGKGATLSFGVAQSICIQQSRFTKGVNRGVLGGALKSPLTQRIYGDFNCIDWDANCGGKDSHKCPLFSRTSCPQMAVQPSPSSARIVGGKEVVPHSYPSLVFMKPGDCSGTILNRNWVVTAKHCIKKNYTYSIRAGVHVSKETAEGEQKIAVERVVSQPDRSGPNGEVVPFDMVLLRLAQPIEFTDKIQPTILPTHEYASGDVVTIAGRGIEDEGRPSNVIREVNMPIISLEKCRKLSEGFPETISDWDICLQDENNFVSACYGDSGGPGYSLEDDPGNEGKKKHVLVGVISYGVGNCYNEPQITALISVFKNLDWINEHIKG